MHNKKACAYKQAFMVPSTQNFKYVFSLCMYFAYKASTCIKKIDTAPIVLVYSICASGHTCPRSSRVQINENYRYNSVIFIDNFTLITVKLFTRKFLLYEKSLLLESLNFRVKADFF